MNEKDHTQKLYNEKDVEEFYAEFSEVNDFHPDIIDEVEFAVMFFAAAGRPRGEA